MASLNLQMSSYLEVIPLDVLVQIAFFTVEPAPLTRLDALRQLSLSSRTMYRLLSIQTCPQLYAGIFRVTFDVEGYYRRSGAHVRTTSCLAAELQRRRTVLRRIRSHQVVDECLLSDLWSIYFMLLESDGLNEMHLHAAGISKWTIGLLSCRCQPTSIFNIQVASLAVAVASLVLSHNVISELQNENRNRILNSIRPFATYYPLVTDVSGVRPRIPQPPDGPPSGVALSNDVCQEYYQEVNYNGLTISTPDLSSSSIFLTFALNEVTPLQIPPHLPATRADAIAAGNNGPTKEDFLAITGTRTPLMADSFHQSQCRESVSDLIREQRRPSRSVVHDEDFYRMTRTSIIPIYTQEVEAYFPGLLTGVWEGSYMVAPSIPGHAAAKTISFEGNQEFLCRQPIQFRLEEHISFTPWLPLPIESHYGVDVHILRDLHVSDGQSSFSNGQTEKAYHYEPFRLSGASKCGRNARHALDVVITGETPSRFQLAWGAYRFIGRVRLTDGLISLTRKPQSAAEDGSGTWVFQGYLRSRRTFVGQWRTLDSTDQPGIGGIFSVSKTTD